MVNLKKTIGATLCLFLLAGFAFSMVTTITKSVWSRNKVVITDSWVVFSVGTDRISIQLDNDSNFTVWVTTVPSEPVDFRVTVNAGESFMVDDNEDWSVKTDAGNSGMSLIYVEGRAN